MDNRKSDEAPNANQGPHEAHSSLDASSSSDVSLSHDPSEVVVPQTTENPEVQLEGAESSKSAEGHQNETGTTTTGA